ncbi:Desosaminyl transferase EryCIII [Balamuthia mandrillaris]
MSQTRASLLTFGSRGDVQPFVAIGLALQRQGYHVTLCAPKDQEGFVRHHGIHHFVPLHFTTEEIMKKFAPCMRDPSKACMESIIAGYYSEDFPQTKNVVMKVCKESDIVLYHCCLESEVLCATEHFKVPAIGATVFPFMVTSQYFPPVLDEDMFPAGTPCSLVWETVLKGGWTQARANAINKWRRELGLSPVDHPLGIHGLAEGKEGLNHRFITMWSGHILPRAADWGENVLEGGFCFLEEDAKGKKSAEQERVEEFLTKGEKPVYFGFGSVQHPNPDTLVQAILNVIDRLKLRAIIYEGAGSLPRPIDLDLTKFGTDRVLWAKEVPHSWLFPQCRAVVIHGGIGTVATALKAAVPPIICPIGMDQPFWAHRLAEKGLGPKKIVNALRVNAEELLASMKEVFSDEEKEQSEEGQMEGGSIIRERVQAVAKLLAAENGVAKVVAVVQQLAPSPLETREA